MRANPKLPDKPGIFTAEDAKDAEGVEFVEFKRLSHPGLNQQCLPVVPRNIQDRLAKAVILSVSSVVKYPVQNRAI